MATWDSYERNEQEASDDQDRDVGDLSRDPRKSHENMTKGFQYNRTYPKHHYSYYWHQRLDFVDTLEIEQFVNL